MLSSVSGFCEDCEFSLCCKYYCFHFLGQGVGGRLIKTYQELLKSGCVPDSVNHS